MQAGSVMAVWELVQPKLWRVVCVVWERGEGAETQDPLNAAGMGVLEGTIVRSIDSRHVGILSRVKAGWRRASNRVRVGVLPQQL